MSKQGRWDEMGELITPDIMKEFAVIGEPGTIAGQMKARYGDIVDRTSAAYANIPKDKRLEIIRQLSA
jgi:alkanesulfonate monooxygenase SsuD/methylene tetrahydromethanopterin reductase-like flavin-dependent oxidoreductase (luciferase family)